MWNRGNTEGWIIHEYGLGVWNICGMGKLNGWCIEMDKVNILWHNYMFIFVDKHFL